MSDGKATPTVHVDNDKVRVTEWAFEPGDATGWHKHELDYVITPLTSSTVRIIGPDGGATEVEMVTGQSYFREAGVEHDVINAGSGELRFVEVEMKP